MSSADQVGWGGTTTTTMGMPSPPMGSGSRPQDGPLISYFGEVAFQDESKTYKQPRKVMTKSFIDKPDCYGVVSYGDRDVKPKFVSLGYGGPGGNCAN